MNERAPLAIVKESYSQEDVDEAFPAIDPGCIPMGSRLCLQLRSAKEKTKGGIILTGNDKDAEKWNTQVAKVISMGPVAFCNRATGEKWPEGSWASKGDFVRIPLFKQDRWAVKNGESEVLFMLVNDLDILAKITCNPLEVRAYV